MSSWKYHVHHGINSIFLYSKLQEVCGLLSVLQKVFKSQVLSRLFLQKKKNYPSFSSAYLHNWIEQFSNKHQNLAHGY